MKTSIRLYIVVAIILLFADPGSAMIDPGTVIAAWHFDEGEGKVIRDTEGKRISGVVMGTGEWVDGLFGKALRFNGRDTYVAIADSIHINLGGPFTNRTIAAAFNCDDVSITARKQVIFEEGGWLRGFSIYVYDRRLYVGGWNRREYNWDGSWLSVPIDSNNWYHVALVLRDAVDAVRPDRFEMWFGGNLVDKAPGGQLYEHPEDTAIGAIDFNTVFHDEVAEIMNAHYFAGAIDEVCLYNAALAQDDILELAGPLAVGPARKSVSTWAAIKGQLYVP